ncbi:hypothetical protein H6504_00325 [Candidatus Woesearchaeota archaeon]|nr:hypothetical protein [Candidatus Woesearchaeota archaeon]
MNTLADIVQKVKEADFTEKYAMHVDGKIWRLYTKHLPHTIQVAYVSDERDLLLAETFQPITGADDEKQNISSILREYCTLSGEVDTASNHQMLLSTGLSLGGMLVGLYTLRHPAGALVGAATGYGISNYIAGTRIRENRQALDAYLSQHRITLGDTAIEQIQGGEYVTKNIR